MSTLREDEEKAAPKLAAALVTGKSVAQVEKELISDGVRPEAIANVKARLSQLQQFQK